MIALEGLQRRYGAMAALDGIDLTLAAGEFFSLLGPSGCGKTTTLRLIAGFERPDAGVIRLQDQDVTRVPPHRRPVNTVFQHYALFPHLSVWDNVAFGLRSRRLPAAQVRQRVGEALEQVQLEGLSQRRPSQLSGGQQQRVALARALINRPAALLLDEPLAALDAGLRRAMQQELKRIQREVGITFLLVTHDQEEALALSDRLAVMQAGRISQVGTPREVYDRPVNSRVAQVLGRANLLPDAGRGTVRMLRPEQLDLRSTAPGPDEEGRRVRVGTVSFQGASLQVDLQADDGTALVARVGRGEAAAAVQPGAELWAVWSAAAAQLLPS